MTSLSRPSGRQADELRAIKIERNYTAHAEGSVLISCGNTKVLCNATVEGKVPRFLRGKNQGWAEKGGEEGMGEGESKT